MSEQRDNPITNALAAAVDKATEYLDARNEHAGADGLGSWSYDWCRFRHDRHCFYRDQINEAASRQVGYAVYIPLDRGLCTRDQWDDERACQLAQPGPKSGHPDAMLDATIPWERGGQRGGVVLP